MGTFIKKIGIILVAVFLISEFISFGSLWALSHSKFYKPSFLVNSVDRSEFDYIIIGSSTGLTTLNTVLIDSVAQTKGINLSMDDTSLASQYVMLQHFIAEGKKTQYCILAPSIKDYDVIDTPLSGNDHRFLPFIDRSYVYDYYHHFDGQEAYLLKYSKWFPFLGVSYYNTELFYPSIVSLIYPEKMNRFDTNGNYTYPVTHRKNDLINQRITTEIQFINPYLKLIKNLCESNGIQLVCYISPVATKRVEVKNDLYISVNHSYLLHDNIYFYDSVHVNSFGRQIASLDFAKHFINIQKNQIKSESTQ